MANYAVGNSTNIGGTQVAVTTTDITLIALIASTIAPAPTIQLRRGKLYDILVGTNGTPADNAMMWSVSRVITGSTLAGAGIASSANLQLDQADSTPASYVNTNSSADVYTEVATNVPWYVGVNQRASYRWVAAPGSEIVWPAVSCSGIILQVKSPTYTGTATGSVMWNE